MNKMSINDFPSLDGVSLIPTKTLELMIDIYNKEVEKEKDVFCSSESIQTGRWKESVWEMECC